MKQIIITLALLLTTCLAAFAQTPSADEQAILKLEEDFRAAKINNDVATLQRVLAEGFYEVNWRGEGSNRGQIIAIFSNSKGRAIELSDLKVQIIGDNAIVRGYQHETRPGMNAYIQFMHFCVKQQGVWKLLAVQQMLDYREGTVTPKGWRGGSDVYFLVGTDTTVKRGGTASAFIKSRHQEDRDIETGLGQSIRADAYRGKRIRLTGYVRGQIELGYAFPWMRVDAEDGEMLSFDNRMGEGFHPTPDWQQFQIVLDVPERGAVIRLGFVLGGRGRVWLDDWSLEVVGTDVLSTHQPPSEAMRKNLDNFKNSPGGKQSVASMKIRLPTLPTAPVNLDFESLSQ